MASDHPFRAGNGESRSGQNMLLCTVGKMLEAGGFLCLTGSAIGMAAGHTSGFQLTGAQTLVIMSLNNSAGWAQGAFCNHFLCSCKPHNNSVVDTGSNVLQIHRIFNSQKFIAN